MEDPKNYVVEGLLAERGAIIIGKYRYLLWRNWDISKQKAVFIMLNPSTADDTNDDPTLRRCIGFARSWDYGGVQVINLFAYRSTDPGELNGILDPIGELNRYYIEKVIGTAGIIVAAWGVNGPKGFVRENALSNVKKALDGRDIYCLDTTKAGEPRHPLYIRADKKPETYKFVYFNNSTTA